MQKMPIQLDKILIAVAKEKALHPYNAEASKNEIEEAWARVGKSNNLSVHESRSIFKVLQKKYDQEKQKPKSAWKLFDIMQEIHKKEDPKASNKEDQTGMEAEEEEEYEMLDVQEEEEHRNEYSDEEDSNHSRQSHDGSPKSEQNEKSNQKTPNQNSTTGSPSKDEKKVLNAMPATPRSSGSTATTATLNSTSAAAAVLQKKGITMKKTTGSIGTAAGASGINNQTPASRMTPGKNQFGKNIESPKTILLSDSIKRKLEDTQSPGNNSMPHFKRIHIGSSTANQPFKNALTKNIQGASLQIVSVKEENLSQEQRQHNQEENSTLGINLITIPANPTRLELTNGSVAGSDGPTSSTSATIATSSTNGFSSQTEDVKNEIIFDEETNTLNGCNPNNINGNSLTKISSKPGDIINFGNFDNSLPPTFFKNLCNSTRYESLGLYVANVMNRLPSRFAWKLETGILKAVIDAQNEAAANE